MTTPPRQAPAVSQGIVGTDPYSTSWRDAITTAERCRRVQLIASSEGSWPEAVAYEKRIFDNSSSMAQYNETLTHFHTSRNAQGYVHSYGDEDEYYGLINIGRYEKAWHIATGATSRVFRSDDVVLKIFTVVGNMAPHNPTLEREVLRIVSHVNIIPLIETFFDIEARMVFVFPYMPSSLAYMLDEREAPLSAAHTRGIMRGLLSALAYLHRQGIIHRDIKPSAVMLSVAETGGEGYVDEQHVKLCDFGAAWHPALSASAEPVYHKYVEVGTGVYRAPETLFGHAAYGPGIDMWAVGAVLAECCTASGTLFHCPPASEDGSQLALVCDIFKTLGTPTHETWPEAEDFTVCPFDIYHIFPTREWHDILRDVDPKFRDLIGALVRYDKSRATAEQALQFECLRIDDESLALEAINAVLDVDAPSPDAAAWEQAAPADAHASPDAMYEMDLLPNDEDEQAIPVPDASGLWSTLPPDSSGAVTVVPVNLFPAVPSQNTSNTANRSNVVLPAQYVAGGQEPDLLNMFYWCQTGQSPMPSPVSLHHAPMPVHTNYQAIMPAYASGYGQDPAHISLNSMMPAQISGHLFIPNQAEGNVPTPAQSNNSNSTAERFGVVAHIGAGPSLASRPISVISTLDSLSQLLEEASPPPTRAASNVPSLTATAPISGGTVGDENLEPGSAL